MLFNAKRNTNYLHTRMRNTKIWTKKLQCQYYLGFNLPSVMLAKRTNNFEEKN